MKRVLAVVLSSAVLAFAGQAFALPKVGKPAPDFSARTFDGKVVQLKDLKGQVVVVNFWATWCGPCKQELPLLDLYYRLQKKAGLMVIAVTTEDSIPVEYLKPLAKGLTMPMAWKFRGNYGPIDDAVPSNFVIDRSGVVRYAEAAAFNLDRLNEVLVPLLREPAPDDAVEPAAAPAAAPGAKPSAR